MTALYEPLVRSLPVAEVAFTEGTLEAILVPWDSPAHVVEVVDGNLDEYDEGFRRGAFDMQTNRQDRALDVTLIPRHGSVEEWGRARSLTDVDAGLHGVLAVHPSRRSDIAAMVDEGIDSMSIEFFPAQRRGRIDAGGVRWRTQAVLRAVAMTPVPVYADAKVLAYRSEDAAAAVDARRRERIAELEAEIEALRSSRWATT